MYIVHGGPNKHYKLVFVPKNSRNILVKSVSFYLERLQRYGVFENVQLFGPPVLLLHSVYTVQAYTAIILQIISLLKLRPYGAKQI